MVRNFTVSDLFAIFDSSNKKIMAQEIIVSRPKQKVDTRIYILSDADLRISPAEFDATPFDMLSRHDFKITEADYKEASYVLYVSPEGLMKVIKERKTISH